MKIDYSRYLIALIITVALFATTFYASNFFANRKLATVDTISQDIAVDVLSNEIQFLFKDFSCEEASFAVNSQINELGDRLSFMESELGSDDERVIHLKKYYSLLEIKDYLLGKKRVDTCGQSKRPIYMIYMYSNKVDCEDCKNQALVLAELRNTYPELRVYTFDYDLPLPPLETLKRIYKLRPEFPITIVEDKPLYGFTDVDKIKSLLPKSLKEATTTASTTIPK